MNGGETGLLPQAAEPAPAPVTAPATAPAATADPALPEGSSRFGITATAGPLGASHYLCDSAVCGDLVAALPASVLVAGRSDAAGGYAVDMSVFLDALMEGAAKLKGREGIAEAASLPMWVVCRMLGTFPVLEVLLGEAMDALKYEVEAALVKAAIGVDVVHKRSRSRKSVNPKGELVETERTEDVLEKAAVMDVAAAKYFLTNRMKERYKDDGGQKQAVQINFIGPEADL